MFCQDYIDGTPNEILKEIRNVKCEKFYGKYKTQKKIQIPQSIIDSHGAHPFYVDDCPPSKRIYEEICFHQVMNCFSVVFSAIQFALYTNPKELYLIGCDCSNGGYFYDTKGKSTSALNKHIEDIIGGYRNIKEFAELHYPDTQIISVNPVGLKGIFRDDFTE